jgi:hypothetical protein
VTSGREKKAWSSCASGASSIAATPINVFISEPFGFAEEYARAQWQTISEGVKAPVIAYPALLKMKLAAGRAKDLLDVENLRKLDPYR